MILVGCSQEENSYQGDILNHKNNTFSEFDSCSFILNSEEESILEEIGDVHNNSMEYGYSEIEEHNLFMGIKQEEVGSVIRKITSDYYSVYINNLGFDTNTDNVNSFLLELRDETPLFSDELQLIMNDYKSLFYVTNNPEEFRIITTQFYESKLQNLSCASDKTAFKAGILVGINSFDYWYHNLDKWENLYKKQNPVTAGKKIGDIDYRDVALADGIGAVTGGVKGAIAGTIFATPVGGVIGGIFGAGVGAASGSLGSVAGSLISWW